MDFLSLCPVSWEFLGFICFLLLGNDGFEGGFECERRLKEKSYEKLWRKKIGKELKRHLSVRKRFNRFSNIDYNYFISLVKQDKIRILLEKFDRDHLSKYAFRLLLREPRFLKFLFI